jgi:Tfp pilus assembly protein FimV
VSDTTEFNMAEAVIARLSRQISDLVVQLAMKDAQVEQLQAQITVLTSAGRTVDTEVPDAQQRQLPEV